MNTEQVLKDYIERISELVTFIEVDGVLQVREVKCNVHGNICGHVFGNIRGDIYGNVDGNIVDLTMARKQAREEENNDY